MTLIARLSDSHELINPAVLVMTGKKSAKVLDKELRGGTYYCPFCEGFREQVRSYGKLTETYAAIEKMTFNVKYRCGCYTPLDEVKRLMHFAHPCGTTKQIQELAGVDIHKGYNTAHDLSVLSFMELFREKYPQEQGYKLEREKFLKLDVPPISRCPDIVIYKGKEVIRAIEVQISQQSFKDFKQRNNNLLLLASEVEWFIDKDIYNRMGEHRYWLTDQGIQYNLFWQDPTTGKLHYDIGKPPRLRSDKSHKRQFNDKELEGSCSIASRIGLTPQELELEANLRKEKNLRPEIEVEKPEYSPLQSIAAVQDSLPRVNYQIGDIVEVHTSQNWELAKIIDIAQTGLPKVQIGGKKPRIHDVFGFNHIRFPSEQARSIKSSSSEPLLKQGSLFESSYGYQL
jgi:hypothetical protein